MWGSSRMFAQARGCEGTEDKLICWEMQVVWDTLHVTEMNILFYGTRVPLEC